MATLTTAEQFNASITITNQAGAVAPVQSQPVWASSDETVVTAVAASDGMSCVISSVAPGGPARVTVSADADLGEGVTEITGVSEDITVTQDTSQQASTITFNLGSPVPKA